MWILKWGTLMMQQKVLKNSISWPLQETQRKKPFLHFCWGSHSSVATTTLLLILLLQEIKRSRPLGKKGTCHHSNWIKVMLIHQKKRAGCYTHGFALFHNKVSFFEHHNIFKYFKLVYQRSSKMDLDWLHLRYAK